jgi:quinolinate synthase
MRPSTPAAGGLREQIHALRTSRNAVILSHNYQLDEVQDIADFVGDSLELSRRAAATTADVIVFCGVRFMAETAALLNPSRTVLLPDPLAGCPLCDMAPVEEVRRWKSERPGLPVVSYVNTSADVKAESDICCTSANAVKVVESISAPEVLFLPDRNLGAWVARHTEKKLHLWNGYCPTHQRITADEIRELKAAHPEAAVMVHPECRPEVIDLADAVLSTSGMLRYARETSAPTIIVGTEVGLLHRLRQENPAKQFLPASPRAVCPNMKLNTLEKILWALEENVHRIVIPEEIRVPAKRAIDRMLEIG